MAAGAGEPWGMALDSKGNVWFAEAGCQFGLSCTTRTPPGEIGELRAGSSKPVLFRLPSIAGNQPIFLAFDRSGNLWFTTPNNSRIGEFNPKTGRFVRQWPVTAHSGPWDLVFAGGKIWYTEHLQSAIGEFDPSTHVFRDIKTPSKNALPYGIVANGNLVWFTENNPAVARIGVFNISKPTTAGISEYKIQASPPSNLTPHLIAIDAKGHPWWSEGFAHALGTLDPKIAKPGKCGNASGDCRGVSEFTLPPATKCGNGGTHVAGIVLQGGGKLVWFDDSLDAQVGSFNPATRHFTIIPLASCSAHVQDRLLLDRTTRPHVWWDELFADRLGRLTQ